MKPYQLPENHPNIKGESGLSSLHNHGGYVVFNFRTGYFGVRAEDGDFSMDKMIKLVQNNLFIKAISSKIMKVWCFTRYKKTK